MNEDDSIDWDSDNQSERQSEAVLIEPPSNKSTEALTHLLKGENAEISTVKANKALVKIGILEEKERPSAKDPSLMKKYKALSDKGLYFGINKENVNNPNETSPNYYKARFPELLDILIDATQ